MKTTTCFTTLNSNSYLYDSENQYMIAIHPVIKLIAGMDRRNVPFTKEQKLHILKRFPELAESDLSFYLKKYFFLKENRFFQEISIQELLSARLTSQTVEAQLSNVDHLLFQVTADCNLEQQSLPEHEEYLANIMESLENNPESFDDINKMTFA